MRICIRYAPSQEDAEQWVHDGFLKIFTALPGYQHRGSFEGWMKRIMVRMCIDQLRNRLTKKHEVEMNTSYGYDDMTNLPHLAADTHLQRADAQDVLMLLNHLPEKQKIVFNLAIFEEYSHKEIADLIGITENYSYLLLFQARKKLKEIVLLTGRKTLKHESK